MTANVDRRAQMLLAALLIATAALYLWNLSATGYGNLFYAAAAEAGSHSWSAWFFGSLDAHNFITVDKPPASLWVTGLVGPPVRHEQLVGAGAPGVMGAASVAVLYATVRRAFGDAAGGTAAGLLAGAALACTPAAALIFRFNNPDALLVLLLTVAGYCLIRAVVGRIVALAGPGRRRDGSRVPDQDARGLPAVARVRLDLSACWRRRAGATACSICSAPRPRWSLRQGGGC